MTIRTRLVLAVLLVTLLPTLVLLAIGYLYLQREQEMIVKRLTTNVTKEVIRQVLLRQDRYQQTLMDLASSPLLNNAVEVLPATKGLATTTAATEVRRELDEILPQVASASEFEDIVLFDNKAQVLYATNDATRKVIGQKVTNGFLYDAYRGGQDHATAVNILDEPDSRHHSMILSYAYRDGRNLRALLFIHLPVTAFQNIFDSVHSLGTSAESYAVIDQQLGAHIVSEVRQLSSDASYDLPYNTTRGLGGQRSAKGETGSGIVTNYAGNTSISSWGYIDALHLGIVTHYEYDDAMRSVRSIQQDILKAVIALVVFLIVLVYIIVTWYVKRPLTHLALVAQQVANGQLDERVHHSFLYQHDEIGKIALAIHNLYRSQKHGPSATADAPKDNPDPIPPDTYHGK